MIWIFKTLKILWDTFKSLVMCSWLKRHDVGDMYEWNDYYMARRCKRCGRVFKEKRNDMAEILFGTFIN